MAKKIKETPILKGKDTKKFLDNMLNASLNKVSEEEYSRMKENYNLFKSIDKYNVFF
jgi:hypothetical protein